MKKRAGLIFHDFSFSFIPLNTYQEWDFCFFKLIQSNYFSFACLHSAQTSSRFYCHYTRSEKFEFTNQQVKLSLTVLLIYLQHITKSLCFSMSLF